jgi:NADPH2:quinone reductase
MRSGDTVLIHACVGGVGGFAVQIAKIAGARVIGTTRAVNHAHARDLGADVVIDYTAQDLREAVRKEVPGGVEIAFDTVGGEVQMRSGECVKKGGVLVSILAYQDEARLQAMGIRTRYVFVAPNSEQLATLGRWADEGRFRPHLAAVLPIEEAARAHELIESKHTRGKIVLRIA